VIIPKCIKYVFVNWLDMDKFEDEAALSEDIWHVKVVNNTFDDKDDEGALQTFRNLQLLVLQGDASKITTISIDNDCMYTIPKILRQFHNLTAFTFNTTRLFTVDIYRVPPSVQHLTLISCNLDYDGVIQGLPLLVNLKSFKGFDIAELGGKRHLRMPSMPCLNCITIGNWRGYDIGDPPEKLADDKKKCSTIIETFMNDIGYRVSFLRYTIVIAIDPLGWVT
jgi:hypothetical protein